MNIQTGHRPAHKDAAGVRMRVVEGLDGFLALREDWNILFERCAQPHQVFQSHLLLSLWARSYGELSRDMAVVTAWQGERLVGALPLVRVRTAGAVALRLMGARIAQFDDMLLDPDCDPDTRARLWTAIGELGADYLDVRRVRADSALRQVLQGCGQPFEMSEAPFACLATRVGKDGPGEAYSSKERSNFRRRLRRLGERGHLSMTTYPAGSHAVSLAMEAIAMKRRFLRRIGVLRSAVNAPEFASFFAGAAADPKSGLFVSTIEIDGRPVAIDLSFLCKGTGFGHVLASDPEWEREAVGSLLVHHVFAAAKEAGTTTFDLLAPADPYKMRHADGTTPVASHIYPFTAKGRLVGTAYRWGVPAARRLAHFAAKLHNRKGPQPQAD